MIIKNDYKGGIIAPGIQISLNTLIDKASLIPKITLKKKGKKIYLAENIFVKHFGGKSHHPDQQEKMEIQRNWHYLWSLFYYSKKHVW